MHYNKGIFFRPVLILGEVNDQKRFQTFQNNINDRLAHFCSTSKVHFQLPDRN
jgi:hypothetical protein